MRFTYVGMALLFVAACSGDGGSEPKPLPPETAAVIEISAQLSLITAGERTQLTARVLGNRGGVLARTVSWSSESPAVASVDGTGMVTGVGPGTAVLVASADGKAGQFSLTVARAPVASVSVSPETATVQVGGSQQLTATPRNAAGSALTDRAVSWNSSAAAVASVDGSGLVQAQAAGTAMITATVEGKAASAQITVIPIPVASVAVSPDSATLEVGSTRQFSATARDASGNVLTGRAFTWSSSAAAVAAVDSSGVIRAVAPGSATITATSEGQSAAATVTVVPVPVASITVSPDTATLEPGATLQLEATTRDASGVVLTDRTVTWASSSDAVATVDAAGAVHAVAAGTASITATSEGVNGSTTIRVVPPPVGSVQVGPTHTLLAVGEAVQLAATVRDRNGAELTGRPVSWSSSSSTVASVDAGGVATAVAPDTALVTITATVDGVSGSATIRASPPSSASHNIMFEVRAADTGATLSEIVLDAETPETITYGGITFSGGTKFSGLATTEVAPGVFSLYLPEATWKFTVRADTYAAATVEGVQVVSGQNTRFTVRLDP